jgi:Sideroflexins
MRVTQRHKLIRRKKKTPEMSSSNRKIPTAPGSSRYDQQTFLGRLRHFYAMTDPRTLLTSQETLQESKDLIDSYEQGNFDADGDEAKEEHVWNALRIRDSMVHPDTGETIFAPLRFSAFAPMNVLICSGLLASSPTVMSIVGWQWFNQVCYTTLFACLFLCFSLTPRCPKKKKKKKDIQCCCESCESKCVESDVEWSNSNCVCCCCNCILRLGAWTRSCCRTIEKCRASHACSVCSSEHGRHHQCGHYARQ